MAEATKPAGRLVAPEAPLTVPTEQAWRAMSLEERLDFQVAINAALSVPASRMSEGRPHKKAKSSAIDALGLHFKTIGRTVYLAEESLEARADRAEAKAKQARADADQALAGLREGLLAILDVRRIPCPDEARVRVESCAEPSTLRQWLVRAKTVVSVDELFAAAPPGRA